MRYLHLPGIVTAPNGYTYGPHPALPVDEEALAEALIARGATPVAKPKEDPDAKPEDAPAPAIAETPGPKMVTVGDFADEELRHEMERRGFHIATKKEEPTTPTSIEPVTGATGAAQTGGEAQPTITGDLSQVTGGEGTPPATNPPATTPATTTAKPASGEQGDPTPKPGELPEGFPLRAALIAAGLDTLKKVRARDFDKEPVSGVGPAHRLRIQAALKAG